LHGTSVGYVFSELQTVKSSDSSADATMNGKTVIVMRLDLGKGKGKLSCVMILSLEHARQLRDDLERVLDEHARRTEDSS
jgi:hypothetical protein